MSAAAPAARRGLLEVFLSLFAEVRSGEGGTVVLLTLDIFLILTAYYIIKPVREALILSGGGAELKSYLSAGQAVLLLLVAVPAYGALASRLPRRRLINTVTLFFVACLIAFYALSGTRLPLGVFFFLWVGIFNLMVVAQFWSFANDLYTVEAGKRLFAIVAFGASAGAVFGSLLTGQLIGRAVGVYPMLLVAAGLLLASLLLTNVVDARERRGGGASDRGRESEPVPPGNSFSLVLGSRYLLLIALLILLLNWINTTGEYILGRTVAAAAADAVRGGGAGGLSEKAWIGRFYSNFFAGVNVAGLLIQLFVVSRILKYLGVRTALLILPVIALGSYSLLASVPLLGAVRWAKTAENATDYSLQNTVRNVLFLPTSREEKYKAKQVIDTFFVRSGDVLSAGLVFAGTAWLHLSARGFARATLVLVLGALALAVLTGLEYRRRTAGRGPVGADSGK